MSTPTTSGSFGSSSVPTSRKIPLICGGHSRPVPDFSYSKITSDGFFIISGCLDGKPMLRNGETGDWIGTFIGHKGAVWSAHLNSNATKAVTASADYTAKLWNAVNGEELHSFNHGKIVKCSSFGPDDSHILTGCLDKILRIYDINKPDAEPLKLEGSTQPIKTAAWTNQPNIIISAAQEPILRIWDTRTLTQVKSINLKAPASSVEVSLDNKHITTSSGKEVLFWDAQTFELSKSFSVSVEANSASLSPDGNSYIVGRIDHWVRVYDFNTSKEQEILKGHHGPVHCVRFAPDSNTFL
jgi:serine-threonine kinase receptor-associated protein